MSIKIVGDSSEFYVSRDAAKLSQVLLNVGNDEEFTLLYGEDVICYIMSFLDHYLVEPMNKIQLPVMYSVPMNTLISEWYVEYLRQIPLSKIKMLFDVALLFDINPLIDLLAIHIGRLYVMLNHDEVQEYFQVDLQFPQEDVDHVRTFLRHHENFICRT